MNDQASHVLLIEDNPGDVDLIRLRMTEGHPGMRMNCVHRLSDALASLEKEMPSLVLLDLNLPDSRGADTFRKLIEKAPNVPVVVLSGQDDEALAMKAVHHGVQDYLLKNELSSKRLEQAMRYAMERHSLLRSLEIARKQQMEFKNRFLSHVSHELRTPLTCIHQYVTILLDGLAGPLAPEQSDHLRTVLKSVNQLQAMIRDLLEATRVESGKLRVEPRCISIGKLIDQAVAMMRPTAQAKRVGLEVGVDRMIPLVYADPDRILEALINLIDNGIKFTPADGAVTVKACMVETDRNSVYISVCDSGRGISPDAKALIFDRLYQDPDSIDNNKSGLGLGLYICRELVRLHQGDITVASELGQGSTFTFNLPVYSLAKLLAPVITYQGTLRPSFVLVRVDVSPASNPPRGNWKDTWQECLETVRRCVYLDKDLVLPPTESAGPAEAFFVVASIDMQRSGVMTRRIREQIDRVADFASKGSLTITTVPIEFSPSPRDCLDMQVEQVAQRVTQTVIRAIAGKDASANGGN